MTKEQQAEKVKDMLTSPFDDGGISDFNEYNQFLCDAILEVLPYMSADGLKYLKRRVREVRLVGKGGFY